MLITAIYKFKVDDFKVRQLVFQLHVRALPNVIRDIWGEHATLFCDVTGALDTNYEINKIKNLKVIILFVVALRKSVKLTVNFIFSVVC